MSVGDATGAPPGSPTAPPAELSIAPPAAKSHATPPGAPSLEARAIQGAAWTVAGYAASQVLRLAGNLILARLLFPEAFGLMALVSVFLQGLQMFSDVGIGPAIVQSKRGDDPAFLDTAWTLQAIRGGAIWLGACAIAWPVARIYGEPWLVVLLPAAATATLISGFDAMALAVLRRRLLVRRLLAIDLSAQLVSIATMIVWAFMRPSVIALIAGSIAGSVARLVLSHAATKGPRNRFRWDPAASAALLRFGGWIFVSTLITFCATRIDRLILGALVPLDVLGVYSLAVAFAGLAQGLTGAVSGGILYPLYAESARAGASALESKVIDARRLFLGFALAVMLPVALYADAFFGVLYDRRYAEAGWMAQLLIVPVWFSILHESSDRVLLAIGDSRSLATRGAIGLIVSVAGVVAGYAWAGIPGLIVGSAAGVLAAHGAVLWRLRQRGVRLIDQDIAYTALAAGLVAGGLAFARFSPTLLGARVAPPVVLLVPALAVAAVGAWAYRRILAQARA